MRIASLDVSQLASARSVLAASCAYDRADVVANEKLFGLGLEGAPIAIGAWMSSSELAAGASSTSGGSTSGRSGDSRASRASSASGSVSASSASASSGSGSARASSASGSASASSASSASGSASASSASGSASASGGDYGGEVLVGVAALCTNRIRVLAVAPDARGRGVGSALLAACEDTARAAGVTTLRTLDEPGNYLAPGIDDRNVETIAWLERRGWQRSGELRENVLIHVRDNPRVSRARADELVASCAARGYEVRRARSDEYALLDAVSSEFGGAWPFELARALDVTGASPGGSTGASPGASPSASSGALPGASSGALSGGSTGASPGASPDALPGASPGASRGGSPSGSTGGSPGASPGALPGASTGASRGGSTGGSPSGSTGASTGGSRGGSTGGSPSGSTGGSPSASTGGSPSASQQPGVHVALRDGAYCAFAAHDGNNAGLGWFGPTGTWPAHRGNGLGEALLVACLVDVAVAHEYCEVAWIGPRPFYDKVAGVAFDRRFVLLTKAL